MDSARRMDDFISAIKACPELGKEVVFHRIFSKKDAFFRKIEKSWSPEIEKILREYGISQLYSHQAEAMGLVRSGTHIVVSTPTASGKSLVFNLPVIEEILREPASRALYLFPLKALSQDQMKSFSVLSSSLAIEEAPSCAIYDGDTPDSERRRIRKFPPNVLIATPEMLHLSFLPYHNTWKMFWENLKFVVLDEVHTYKGVNGSHMAWVFRRMKRMCRYYGADPTFIFCSATVGNPADLASALLDQDVQPVTESGAPMGRRHLLFLNPLAGAAITAISLLKEALRHGLRTIVYAQSRRYTELISLWASQQAGPFSKRICAYRAGFLPEERREIEERLVKGDLLAVVSTSALELGIDIGSLDLCILVGYPGSIMSTWQRGGRVGRSLQDSAIAMVAQEDALDQYFMRNPEDFINRPPESAVVNPYNPVVVAKHLKCAASELPLISGESCIKSKDVLDVLNDLVVKGEIFLSADGGEYYSASRNPQREFDLRGIERSFQIVSKVEGRTVGVIDGFRAYRETHPGAIYIHMGKNYIVDDLNLETRTVQVRLSNVNYFTRVRGNKHTEILETFASKWVGGARVHKGKLRVTDQVTGYERRAIRGQRLLNVIDLDLPPQVFETEGIWWEIPAHVQKDVERAKMHFMGGIHALEHAAIGILPLIVLADRNDLGGISTPFHPQTGSGTIFIYDAVPGGVGLCNEAYLRADELFRDALKVIKSCECETGCPSCVHSPKCGSGNRPIDKEAALYIINALLKMKKEKKNQIKKLINPPQARKADNIIIRKSLPRKVPSTILPRYGVLDIETQLSAQEVGGWHRSDLMKVSCAVLYDSHTDSFSEFLERDIHGLIERFSSLDLIIGFNVKRFDYKVLSAYTNYDFWNLKTLDILEEVHDRLGYRLSLDHLANVTLGTSKSANGLQALKWWKEGKIKEIIEYCKKDVKITRDLFLHGYNEGHLLFKNKARKVVRIQVDWGKVLNA